MALELVVGENTYVTVVEADEFINTFYLPEEPITMWWDSLSLEAQGIYLVRSCKNIEKLPFTGYKTDFLQTLMFPRSGELEVPVEVKEAQILNAYYLSTPPVDVPSSRGVKKYTIDDISEEYFGTTDNLYKIVNPDLLEVLQPWLRGGYEIR